MASLNKVLYVEDDVHVRTTVSLVLEVIGRFDVRACSNGHDALMAARGFRPDLIVLDVMLPELDGLETLHALREQCDLHEVPVMFMTAQTTQADLARYADAGSIGVIPKPVTPLRLVADMRNLWEQAAF
jgi:DNA-binding response OmpR family regulator